MNKKNIKKNIMFGIFLFIISFFCFCNYVLADCKTCTSNPNNICPTKKKNQKNYCSTYNNLDESLEDVADFWEVNCSDGECPKEYLQKQKKFYQRLYGILKTYQSKDPSLYIDDHVILEVAFFGLTPGDAALDEEEYNDENDTEKDSYYVDEESLDDPSDGINENGSDGENSDADGLDTDDNADEETADTSAYEAIFETLTNYYETEKDTLKTLINNALTIDAKCWIVLRGLNGTVQKEYDDETKIYREYCVDENGKETDEYQPTQITKSRRKCAKLADEASATHSYYQYYLTTFNKIADYVPALNLLANGLKILKSEYVPTEYEKCKSLKDSKQKTYFTYYGSDFKVDYGKFWEFLVSTRYFDEKAHLNAYFQSIYDKILEEKNVTVRCMDSDICDTPMTNDLYEEYAEDIHSARETIVYHIMGILETYLSKIYSEDDVRRILDYDGYYDDLKVEIDDDETIRKSFFWPIGSDETEERDGRTYADGDPASTDVISYFGNRKNPVTGEDEFHYGIDIKGVDGVTNVIAVFDGTVVEVYTGCTVGDYTCNNGLGNMITIQHSNGDYTVYAHLSEVLVSNGYEVKRGELIGKVGQTGSTLEACLHFEIRIGGNSVDNAVNPLIYLKKSNPRPKYTIGSASKSSVCQGLKDLGYSDEAVAAIMVNMYYESKFHSDVVQGDGNYSSYSVEYTEKVDSGVISESDFVNKGPGGGGYGLCQWTDSSRKQRLYNIAKKNNASISDLGVQLELLNSELNGIGIDTGKVLKDPTKNEVYKTWYFCYHFERPGNRNLCGVKGSSSSDSGRSSDAPTMLSYVKNGCS